MLLDDIAGHCKVSLLTFKSIHCWQSGMRDNNNTAATVPGSIMRSIVIESGNVVSNLCVSVEVFGRSWIGTEEDKQTLLASS